MTACVLIPARYSSTRFPGKPLVSLLGKPMVLWVAELSARAVGKDHVFVATDDERIADVVEKADFRVVRTSSRALTGTDRIAEASKQLDYDVFINVQGDEPLVDPKSILKCIELKGKFPDQVINGYCAIEELEDPHSVNIPKVAMTENGLMQYMSRLAVPGFKDPKSAPTAYFKQVCIYGFSADELSKYLQYGRKGTLEAHEDIEVLRFSELGISVRMFETAPGSLAVDVPNDVPRVEAALKALWDI